MGTTMTFTKAVLKRKAFECRIMGMPFFFTFDETLCQLAEADGVSDPKGGGVLLNPALFDNALLDTAAHEVVEIATARMEWAIPHQTIQQLGFLVGSILECEV